LEALVAASMGWVGIVGISAIITEAGKKRFWMKWDGKNHYESPLAHL